jgi:hypothetical protein
VPFTQRLVAQCQGHASRCLLKKDNITNAVILNYLYFLLGSFYQKFYQFRHEQVVVRPAFFCFRPKLLILLNATF